MRAAGSLKLLVLVTSMTVAGWASGKDRLSAPKQSVFLVGCTLKKNILFMAKDNYTCCCPADTTGGGESPRIRLLFANKAVRPLWIAVTLMPPSSQEVCEHRGAIEAKGKIDMFFTQDSHVAEGDYAIRIMAFADSAFADTVESTGWKVRPR